MINRGSDQLNMTDLFCANTLDQVGGSRLSFPSKMENSETAIRILLLSPLDFVVWDHAIGYARISQFGTDTAAELRTTIGRLSGRGMKGLILDLRGCPGGLLSAAVETGQMFLSRGTIVTIRGRDEAAKPFTAEAPAIAPDVPLVVLVDGTTASAGEIVAGALKDNDRAVIVGSRTFGKGSVQSLVKLKDGSGAIRLTSAYYQLPRGANIDKREGKTSWGVDPTDGYYVPVDGKTRDAMTRKRRGTRAGWRARSRRAWESR